MRRNVAVAMALAVWLVAGWGARGANPSSDRLTWWRDAHFGMFIHWGLYAIPAGEWNGKEVPGIGEWIMNRAKIPVREYEQLATKFNPVKFNADEWVNVAKSAGQRYMVITSKHHDGFAMWHSKVSKYNVYDATPFHRDVIGELAAACKRKGMKLGFYYSQTQDWHEPDGDGNTWDFDPAKTNFDKYFHEKAIPQVRELLTNYGPVALIWFDTPKNITAAQSKELVDLVHTLQPDCLVDGRIGNNMGDYRSMGDNEIPARVLDYDWEVPVTLNDTWGFKKNDHNWKSAQTLIRQLVDVVSKNGNYLLNVGPTSEGLIPQPSVERLKEVGRWLHLNGEAVYGAKPSPYSYEFEWGSLTSKANHLYVNVVQWPKDSRFELFGLESRVSEASLPGRAGQKVRMEQRQSGNPDRLTLTLPSQAPDPNVSVVALTVDGMPKANRDLMQQPDGVVTLNGQFASLDPGSKIKVSNRGIAQGWISTTEKLEWSFDLFRAGTYDVIARTALLRGGGGWDQYQWKGGDELKVSVSGKQVEHALENQGRIDDPRNPLMPDVKTVLGRVTLQPGTQKLSVQATKINPDEKAGVRLREIQLVLVQ